MLLTKHAHACVVVSTETSSLVIDPGTFTPDSAEILARVDAVLLTHDHFDHLDVAAVTAAVIARPGLPVYGTAAVAEALPAETLPDGAVTVVGAGSEIAVGDLAVRAFETELAVIHPDLPRLADLGYLVSEPATGAAVFDPGDAYLLPGVPVDTLLLPTSGPWTKLGDAIDYVRAVAPARVVQIHESMLSELGQRSAATFLENLAGIPLTILQPGESLELPPV